MNAFRTFGFQVAEEKIALRNGRETTRRVIQAPNPAVSVLFHGSTCVVGLESMTPEQSNQLARTWVLAYEAQPNSRLANIVSGAWRSFFTESAQLPVRPALTHRIYIAAYKTWPSGPYDPQRNVPFNIDGLFPDKPGAAVRLTYVIDCDPLVKTDANTTLLLSCDPAGGTGEYYEIKTR
ncbi:hypothetical protein [Thalassococcus lentus]|uniref:Uncharacterized protein n=1 Tax=Thalassococcus lentus TaxID=1210524 RepID=A0ABT4XWX1_9RHOB|nr:hypothetical protein [Thalassococcus lentus]MDA7426473.1 hypothetical protein [Thalassococcus lentus]